MKASKTSLFIGIVILFLVGMSCSIPGTGGAGDLTQVAGTVAAELTKRALGDSSLTPSGATETPNLTFTITSSPMPSETLAPSATFTITPTFTNTPLPCNKATFMGDLTIPDGTEIIIGSTFVKTWRIQNAGSCTWNSSYQLIFVDGNQMSAPAAVQLTAGSIAPGASVDVSVQMKAPDAAGEYKAYFRMKASDGTIFGVGNSNTAVSAEIKAIQPTLPPPPEPLFPDLYVSEFQINNGNPIDDDVPIHVRLGVYNKGNAAAGAFTVRFWGLETFANHSCQWEIASLAFNGGRILECDMQYSSTYADGLKAKVQVDVFGTVSESNEGNNIFLQALNFAP